MRVLLLGSGGRESALAEALARSPSVDDLVVAPGNPGVAAIARVANTDPTDPARVVELARKEHVDLVVVGPEAPLVAGVGDALRDSGIDVFGPNRAAARLEGSKSFAKEIMAKAGVVVPRWGGFTDAKAAVAFLDDLGPPHVVKVDGLAAGKGVVVTDDRQKAVAAVEDSLVRGKFADAGKRVVIEEYLAGDELSLIAFTDGRVVVACEPAQDYKRVYDADEGPNTGGMGSYSPVPVCPPSLAARISEEIMEPVVRALADSGSPFVGALYAGLVLTADGPRVLEFNARFGDPETQALVPRLRSDFAEVCMGAARRELEGAKLDWSPERCVCVVLASSGYPASYDTGIPISGIDEAEAMEEVNVFHAGTAESNGGLVTAGGRVLAVSATAPTFERARLRAYAAADVIRFEGKHARTDIGLRAEEMETERK
ncbi:MAG: phosphoribosylamine--glycine ligase [Actinomycetota bacterium]|nr:phosphoribosylamine--glycine ligase [Actinomycetota bacterium]